MKTSSMSVTIILTAALNVCSAAGQPLESSEKQEKYVSVFSLTVNEMNKDYQTGYREIVNFDISASTNSRNKHTRAIESSRDSVNSYDQLFFMPREVSVTHGQYLSLLDLAVRQPTQWEGIVYEQNKDCSLPQYIKNIRFNGKTQTVISSCQVKPNNIPQITTEMKRLINRLMSYSKN